MKATKTLRAVAVLAAALTLSACGHIAKETTSADTMLDKAEFETGIDRKNLRVVEGSIEGSMDAVHYKVKAKNGLNFRCYFTSALAVTSDAICTPIDGDGKAFKKQKEKAAKSGNCNALLRAAGRC